MLPKHKACMWKPLWSSAFVPKVQLQEPMDASASTNAFKVYQIVTSSSETKFLSVVKQDDTRGENVRAGQGR